MGHRLAFFTFSLGGGGAERVVVTLASHYAAQGHAVDFIVSRREDTYLKEVHPEVRIHYLHTRRRMLAAPRLAKALREIRPVALLATVNTFAAVLAQRLARIPTRVILREATIPSIALQVQETSALKRAISETAMRWLYPRADAVVAVSKGVAQDLLNLMPQLIPIAWAKLTKTSETEDPLLKVPPARRGNRTGARRGSPREAGGT